MKLQCPDCFAFSVHPEANDHCPVCGAGFDPPECPGHLAVDCGFYDTPIGEVMYCDGTCS